MDAPRLTKMALAQATRLRYGPQTAGSYVCSKIAAHKKIGEVIEANDRRWRSQAFENAEGIRVVVATHPGIANWYSLATDPSRLVVEALG